MTINADDPKTLDPKTLTRYCLSVAYHGKHCHGWQRQLNVSSVQQLLEAALSRVADLPITVQCAGRTDHGVHAVGQVVHFDSPRERSLDAWLLGTNTYLPEFIRVQWVQTVDPHFHARFSALSRRYVYCFYQNPQRLPYLDQFYTWQRSPLAVEPMHLAAQCLLGEHDFTSFRGADCQARSAVRRVSHVRVVACAGGVVCVDIQANAFLYHMVRNIVGCLRAIGEGKYPVAWMSTVLAARDRKVALQSAPAQGLHFVRAEYPAPYDAINRANHVLAQNFLSRQGL